jgi:hypothetical protein
MSNTRHAEAGSSPRQERFISSFDRGLLANLVSKRCVGLSDSAKSAIWFIQLRSWQAGGLEELAREMGRNCSRSADAGTLEEFCLNPGFPLSPLCDDVDVARSSWIASRPRCVQTDIGRRISAALDYTLAARCCTVIDGASRIGKTFAVKQWVENTAGRARYAQIPSTNDDIGFFRAIGIALGVSCSLQLKAAEIRARIEDVLQRGDLMLALDEGHYCWPQNWQRYAAPARVNWLMTALVNYKVPVALITTPQFYAAQKRVETLTGWNSDQFNGRIGHVERLPERLDYKDLLAVAKAMLPGIDTETLGHLSTLAECSSKHLATIDAVASRATWMASKDGRTVVKASDIKNAVRENISPMRLADRPAWRSEQKTLAGAPRGRRRGAATGTRNVRPVGT